MKHTAPRVVVLLLATGSAFAAEKPLASLESASLISPIPVVEERTGHVAKPMGDYIAALRDATLARLSVHPELPSVSVSLVVVVKPEQLSRCWIESGAPGLDVLVADELKAACEGVTPFEAQGGPIAFALNFKIRRGGKSPNYQGLPYPLPAEWVEALSKLKSGTIPDDAISAVWP